MRLMMDNQKKYDEEQFFLTKGFRCKEVEEGFPANFVSKAYGLVSGYGTSLLRPALGLGVLWALGWLLLAPLVCLNNAEPVGMQTSCGMGMGFVSFRTCLGFWRSGAGSSRMRWRFCRAAVGRKRWPGSRWWWGRF